MEREGVGRSAGASLIFAMLNSITERLQAGHHLDRGEVAVACEALFAETASLATKVDFLRALRAKGETPEEIASFVLVLLERGVTPDLGGGILDVCGTGGDNAGLFNVSTAVMFVAAACGARVVKHGNRGVTSKSGGADVLEALGVNVHADPAQALEAAGCCFLFAPNYHPAFKAVAEVRKAIAAQGESTIFNMLGPLLNPARPDYQLAGVYNEALLQVYAEAFRLLGRKRAWAAHGAGGLDEMSILGPTKVFATEGGEIRRFEVLGEGLGVPLAKLEDLRGGSAQENAALLEQLLRGQLGGAKRDIVALNAAGALVVAGIEELLPNALVRAQNAMVDGAAFGVLERLRGV